MAKIGLYVFVNVKFILNYVDSLLLMHNMCSAGMPPLRSEVPVPIKIMNKATPVFDEPFYEVSIPENVPMHTAILTVEAVSPTNQKLIYSISNGDVYSEFAVHFNTGEFYHTTLPTLALTGTWCIYPQSAVTMSWGTRMFNWSLVFHAHVSHVGCTASVSHRDGLRKGWFRLLSHPFGPPPCKIICKFKPLCPVVLLPQLPELHVVMTLGYFRKKN